MERIRQGIRASKARRRLALGLPPQAPATSREDPSPERMAQLERSLQAVRQRFGHKGRS